MTGSAYERFRALHEGPRAFIMPNVWDGVSALMMRDAGFAALGSSSFAYGATRGLPDVSSRHGRSESVAHAAWLAEASGLPVNGDLADGFGPTPEDCVATVEASVAAGLAGLGIEDTTGNPAAPIHDFDAAVRRIEASAQAARGRIVLTGRTDNFLCGRPDLDDTLRRLTAFAEAGADVLYAPGLPDMESIRRVVQAVAPKPVNVLIGPKVSLAELEAAGVRRVSLGGALYRVAMGALARSAAAMRAGDLPAAVAGAMPGKDLQRLVGSA